MNLNKDLINFDQDYQSTSGKDIIFNSDKVTHRKYLSIDTDNNSHFKSNWLGPPFLCQKLSYDLLGSDNNDPNPCLHLTLI